jgi:hypothetical protein
MTRTAAAVMAILAGLIAAAGQEKQSPTAFALFVSFVPQAF